MAESKSKENEKKSPRHVLEQTPRGNNGTIGGMIQMSQEVVETIAGLAAREIEGIYALGKSRLISFTGDDPKHGITAEVGEREAAIDLEVVIEYGCDVRETVKLLRQRVGEQVDKMAGRKVVEVNVDVIDLHIAADESAVEVAPEKPRVR
jgi:uncharacterized alkaline shock family protein YloU